MKKTYISPEIACETIALVQMIAASNGQALNITGNSATHNFIDENASGEALSRDGGGLWDGDEY